MVARTRTETLGHVLQRECGAGFRDVENAVVGPGDDAVAVHGRAREPVRVHLEHVLQRQRCERHVSLRAREITEHDIGRRDTNTGRETHMAEEVKAEACVRQLASR